MKYLFILMFFTMTFGLYGQIQQDVNTQSGTIGNLLTDIDSISFDLDLGIMIVFLNNGNIHQHPIPQVINVKFSEHEGPFPPGTVHCDPDNPTEIVEVLNPATGRIWMDRNLGASRVAESSTDSLAFGDLYQWGRKSDGHQCRNSPTTSDLSNFDQPGHSDFILSPSQPSDWRIEKNDDLWNGINAVTNPCPENFRIPTNAEWNQELLSWNSNDYIGAFETPLKLTVAGWRFRGDGEIIRLNTTGLYWSSTTADVRARYLHFDDEEARLGLHRRADGQSVRCLRD